MGTGKVGNLTRAGVTGRRTAALTVVGLAVVVGALLFPLAASANHDASDFFAFAQAEYGKEAEPTCDGSQNSQVYVSGSTLQIRGRIHSNADFDAPGSGVTFTDAVTYGLHPGTCQGTPGSNTYNAGPPANVDSTPTGVTDGWPGDLASYLNGDGLTFGTDIEQILGAGAVCDVGDLSNGSDIVIDEDEDGLVVCNGDGKVELNAQNQSMSVTIISHGQIVISGQGATLSPAAHGILAWTDQDSHDAAESIIVSGSNFTVPDKAILFASRSGIDVPGSNDSSLCIQLIAQGKIKVQGSTSTFGPGACEGPPPPQPQISVDKIPNSQTIPAGQPLSFTITVNSTGTGSASNVVLTDNLPQDAGLDWEESPDNPNCSIAGALGAEVLTCNFGILDPQQSRTVTVTSPTDVNDCQTYDNTANVTADGGLSGSNDGQITVQCPQAPPTIVVTKEATPLSLPEPGGLFTFNVTVQNTSAESVTIQSLGDSVHGSQTGDTDCQVGTVLLAGASCSFSFQGTFTGSPGDEETDIVTVCATDADQNLACDDDPATVTITDVEPTLVVTKEATPLSLPEPGGSFTFNVTVQNTSGESVTITSLADDTYPGQTGDADCQVGTVLLAGASCSFSFQGTFTGNAGDSETDTVEVCIADDDQNALCADDPATVTITRNPGTIIVKKVTDPAGGQGQLFTFTGDAEGDIGHNDQIVVGDLNPGTYTSTETVHPDWNLTSIVCDDHNSSGSVQTAQATFQVEPGETVTCTFTNTIKRGTIIVEKQTDPAGSNELFTFTGDAAGQIPDNGQIVVPNLLPDTYTSTETVPEGWDLTSIVCEDPTQNSQQQGEATALFDVAPGETVKCTFNNELRRGKIIVEKQTDPAGGQGQLFTFTGDAAGEIGHGDQIIVPDLLPGTYTSTETVPEDWNLTSIVCTDPTGGSSGEGATATFDVAPGETVTCVFNNAIKRGTIIVEKQTDPAGSHELFTFTGDAAGQIPDNGQIVVPNLLPDTYTSTETVPDGWDLTSIECEDPTQNSQQQGEATALFDVAPGETVTCVFTNQEASEIIIEKQTLPNGDHQVFHFDASYDEGGFSLIDDQQNESGDLEPGQYTVGENVPEGWDLTDIDCGEAEVGGFHGTTVIIDLAAGETVTCVFENTKRGSIIVEKQTNPHGAAGSFTFTGDAEGTIGDNGHIVEDDLEPGTYTSTEGLTAGFNLTGITCDDENSTGSLATRTATFELDPGEIVTCTFTNTQIPTLTGQGSIDVQKSADPTSLKEPGGLVNFTVKITNTSTVNVTITEVHDSVFGDLDDTDGGAGIFDTPINLAPGESVSRTFQRQVNGVGGQAHVNVVTARGGDEFGNPVSDSDDARVDITPRLIDLVIVKDATSPTPLNGIVNYTMTVTNKGPDTATNVQLADPAPAGIVYLTVNPGPPTCNLTPALITCSLGNLAAGESRTITVTARAIHVGTHTNTATVTGGGGRETNPADNVDDAVTVVPAPARPPTVRPDPPPKVCLTLTVAPRMIKADGKPDKVTVKVTAGKKRVKGTKVSIFGAGVKKTGRSNAKGIALMRINPRRAGLITITAIETNQKVCGPKRIGVVGVFLPPLTG
jgi:uncharacterized repeat protein (TIGR01451 family)